MEDCHTVAVCAELFSPRVVWALLNLQPSNFFISLLVLTLHLQFCTTVQHSRSRNRSVSWEEGAFEKASVYTAQCFKHMERSGIEQ